ncbi:undecaprenyl-diphosphate phosphatase [Candidatus Sumerlaeota bacterium]|nr:undecaprenyl-diphosphate phosphatase [Candidatus Sumerlaeota bacterium]
MNAIILGIVQGLTEFLPISSSGHLVLFQQVMDVHSGNVLFELVVHLGTLLAILIVFRFDLRELLLFAGDQLKTLRDPAAFLKGMRETEEGWLITLIAAATLCTAAIGLTFEKFFQSLFEKPGYVGVALFATGVLLFATRYFKPKSGDEASMLDVPLWAGAAVGVMQGFAIIPGISRSGSTIAVALMLGFSRELAGRFSFLIFIPAILGAFILQFKELYGIGLFSNPGFDTDPYFLGLAFSFIFGYFALKILLRFLRNGRLHWWSAYCWIVGLAAIVRYFGR